MKTKILIFLLSIITLLSACLPLDNSEYILDELVFVGNPYTDPGIIMNEFSEIEQLLQETLSSKGFNVRKVTFYVATSQITLAEALSAGTAHIGLLSVRTFLLYEDAGIKPLLQNIRPFVNVDSNNPADWNTGNPIRRDIRFNSAYTSNQILVGPSDYGRFLYRKFLETGDLSWEDLDKGVWCLRLNSGFNLTDKYLIEKYNKTRSDVTKVLPHSNTAEAVINLSQESCDIITGAYNIRTDYEQQWINDWGRTHSIWDEVKVIAITGRSLMGVLAVTENEQKLTDDFIDAIKLSFNEIIETEKGQELFSVYNISGYEEIDYNALNDYKNLLDLEQNYEKSNN